VSRHDRHAAWQIQTHERLLIHSCTCYTLSYTLAPATLLHSYTLAPATPSLMCVHLTATCTHVHTGLLYYILHTCTQHLSQEGPIECAIVGRLMIDAGAMVLEAAQHLNELKGT
jgi:hypothetical protein